MASSPCFLQSPPPPSASLARAAPSPVHRAAAAVSPSSITNVDPKLNLSRRRHQWLLRNTKDKPRRRCSPIVLSLPALQSAREKRKL
ncbi:hypothetical protein M0R45_025885 [Rubus argutus]|uniref:Uncharacterized protein n=1 Tax=Rubus argutus TaxID=59490 RepID=A0AAW1WXI2_RUBAR